MKIVSINVHYQDGLGYQDYYLGKAWKELGHEVNFISSDVHFDYPDYDNTVKHIIGDKNVGTGVFLNDYNVPVHRLKGTKRKYTGLIWLIGLKKKIKELNPDIIVAHGIFTWHAIRLLLWYKEIKCTLIFDDHTTTNVLRKGAIAEIIYFIFRSLFADRFLKYAKKLIGVSETCIHTMNTYFGLSGEKVVMIPLGTDTNLFNKNEKFRGQFRESHQISETDTVIVYTGKMYDEKKVHLIFDAIEKIDVDKEKIIVLLVGDIAEQYRDKLYTSINKSSCRVIINKAVPIDKLPVIYNAADIAVWPDHTTNSTIDASACGCPIICSHYMPERVKYNNGILITGGNEKELQDALFRLIIDVKERKVMGERGVEYVQNELSWNAIAKKFIE